MQISACTLGWGSDNVPPLPLCSPTLCLLSDFTPLVVLHNNIMLYYAPHSTTWLLLERPYPNQMSRCFRWQTIIPIPLCIHVLALYIPFVSCAYICISFLSFLLPISFPLSFQDAVTAVFQDCDYPSLSRNKNLENFKRRCKLTSTTKPKTITWTLPNVCVTLWVFYTTLVISTLCGHAANSTGAYACIPYDIHVLYEHSGVPQCYTLMFISL